MIFPFADSKLNPVSRALLHNGCRRPNSCGRPVMPGRGAESELVIVPGLSR